MNREVLLFFHNMPEMVSLYEAVESQIKAAVPDVTVKVQKSQIAFCKNRNFAFIWIPIHKVKGRPETYIVVSFGLNYKIEHPRIVEAVEPYPNRWTHHVIISEVGEVDGQLLEWIKEAYDFSITK